MKVLLIEPNQSLGNTYRRAFETSGHTVAWRRTAQTAITAADQTRPDVVVLELELVGHSGIEFLYEFRSYADWQTIPVIVNTFTSEENFVLQRHQFQALGVVACLYKPTTSLSQLTRTINTLPAAVV
jgi:DNA-binding response OmpR family regulator